jgi:hypothetical protein
MYYKLILNKKLSFYLTSPVTKPALSSNLKTGINQSCFIRNGRCGNELSVSQLNNILLYILGRGEAALVALPLPESRVHSSHLGTGILK